MSYCDYSNRLFYSRVLSILALTGSEATGDLALFWGVSSAHQTASNLLFFFPQLNYSMRKPRTRASRPNPFL